MLRITVNNEGPIEIWELEGKLSGDWVKELDRWWTEKAGRAGAHVQVNLKSVSYIDASGKQLLKEMHESGIEIKGCGCMARAVVEEIVKFARGLSSRVSTKKIVTVISIFFGAGFFRG